MIYERMWLEYVKDDIYSKYGMRSPKFFINGTEVGIPSIFSWLEELRALQAYGMWPQYKHLEQDAFKLEKYSANPRLELCKNLIDKYLKPFVNGDASSLFTVSGLTPLNNDVMGTTPYTLEEVRGELLYLFLHGSSRIIEYRPASKVEGEITHHLWVIVDSLPNMLRTGYMTLEYTYNTPEVYEDLFHSY